MQQHPSISALDADPAGLPETIKQEIRDALANMAKVPGFKPRHSQRKMIAEIAKTLAGEYSPSERIICVEGPTGTGKGLGYLLATIPIAKHRKKQLVISTATVALQEQLMTKDLPAVREQAGLEVTYALAKGRRRYVCDRNLEQLAGGNGDQQDLDLWAEEEHPGGATWRIKPAPGELEMVQAMWDARTNGTWNGDLDAWESLPRNELKSALTTDRAGCTGNACPFRAQCAFFSACEARKDCDVIVANHALVISDLMASGGTALPTPDEAIYVFDEGHHLPAVAVEQGAAGTRLMSPLSTIDHLTTIPEAIRRSVPERPDLHKVMDEFETHFKAEVSRLKERLADLQEAIRSRHPTTRNSEGLEDPFDDTQELSQQLAIWRFERGIVPDELKVLFTPARTQTEIVLMLANKLVEKIRETLEAGAGGVVTSMALSSAQSIAAKVDVMRQTFALFAQDAPQALGAPPYARWIEAVDLGEDFECCATPSSAASLLRDILWSQCKGAVVTSATLAALGRFDRLFDEMGLGPQYGTHAIRLPSPFDYRRNAELVIPAMRASPKNASQHTAEVIERCNSGLIDLSEGTLMLFASYRQMREVAKGLDPRISSRILMQGEAPRRELLKEHRRRIEAGEGSVLFGVASFSEGLDLPGPLCTHVIIAKLFFAVPDSPVERTRAEWLESLGRNPFVEISVPDASFKLIQAVGRLLRTETDTGRVTVLDRRLVDTGYGRQMLEALPSFTRNIERASRKAA